ncbi:MULTISPECIES: LysR substrate-binding domain-containing protein [unclassified Beijerinckia]|uniref:LysR substrate-binding domain-containing protein n=1 Tax=unclassified Beijerinckia TaxID=2638183 RepID=UPI00089A9120|nr:MULTISPECIES: LysR substrate-binding domain-containing protein [unclassified Beijerinckia]MDH7794156.1 DNA-binding transcriptional LysR family regulator [Beijerinckia sp. GAS462]SEB54553.1 DNA-binding transcriptional regulator, LysR family [Beijerinckia sp. 28-YEA-48]
MRGLDDLYLFKFVVDNGGFAAVSRRLHQPKSTVARRIAELERQLGSPLLHRGSSKRFALTAFGQECYAHCVKLAEQADGIFALADRNAAEPSGSLHVICPPLLSHMFIEQWAVEFAEIAPKVHLHLDATTAIFDPRAVAADMIIYGALSELPDSDLTAKKLLTTPYGLVASPGCAARQPLISDPQGLTKCDCLGFGSKTMDWRWSLTKGRKTESVRFAPRFSSTQLSALHTASLRGLGIAALPLPGCEDQLADGRLVRILPEWSPPDANIFALFPSRRALSAAASQFLDFVTMRLREVGSSVGSPIPSAEWAEGRQR